MLFSMTCTGLCVICNVSLKQCLWVKCVGKAGNIHVCPSKLLKLLSYKVKLSVSIAYKVYKKIT